MDNGERHLIGTRETWWHGFLMGLQLVCITFLSRNNMGPSEAESPISLPLLLRACLKVPLGQRRPLTFKPVPAPTPYSCLLSSSSVCFPNPPLGCSSSPQGLPRSALFSSSPCGFAITSLSGCTGSQALAPLPYTPAAHRRHPV